MRKKWNADLVVNMVKHELNAMGLGHFETNICWMVRAVMSLTSWLPWIQVIVNSVMLLKRSTVTLALTCLLIGLKPVKIIINCLNPRRMSCLLNAFTRSLGARFLEDDRIRMWRVEDSFVYLRGPVAGETKH